MYQCTKKLYTIPNYLAEAFTLRTIVTSFEVSSSLSSFDFEEVGSEYGEVQKQASDYSKRALEILLDSRLVFLGSFKDRRNTEENILPLKTKLVEDQSPECFQTSSSKRQSQHLLLENAIGIKQERPYATRKVAYLKVHVFLKRGYKQIASINVHMYQEIEVDG
ncbi:hypothetical protein BDF21DRAFT_456657 [Thamnidium elegans]|nr:hypothetical protein BDF21DRAFT_456657 [Thamnidium elegans]